MWSHSINDDSIGGGDSDTPQDSFCRSCDKASSDFDVRHMFNLSAVYQLPVGAGKRYLSTPGVARTVLGGWSLSAIGSAQTGLPFNITVNRSRMLLCRATMRSAAKNGRIMCLVSRSLRPRVHAVRVGKPGRIFHACFRDFWRSGPKCLSRSSHI
jgi:hypothetical protein